MSDPIPHNDNRLGYLLGYVFHPFVVFVPALFAVLKDTDPLQSLAWVVFIALMILAPVSLMIARAQRRERYTYQRITRHSLYVTFWLSILLCLTLAFALDAPKRLASSLLALIIWVPLQFLVNARFTKISAHTAVVTGIATALILMGNLNSIALVIGAGAVILATAWARVVTGQHSLLQVGLGIVVSATSVLIAFTIMPV